MKVSLSWLFDHINGDWRSVDVKQLVHRFNKSTAEIEGFEHLTIDTALLFAGIVVAIERDHIELEIPELKKKIMVAVRTDARVGYIYLVCKKDQNFDWVKLTQLGSDKEGLLAALEIPTDTLSTGQWRTQIEAQDVILQVDNKSINHRPDMWGHRGIAREIAVLLNLSLKPLSAFCSITAATANMRCCSITIQNPNECRRFSGVYIEQIENRASSLKIASRLARVDSRPINFLVDATNYVMFDIGQPMHAFDAARLAKPEIVIRNAKEQEKVTLLDGQTVALTPSDCVVTDGTRVIALAGIMGADDSGINASTSSIFVESANFDPATIRKTAMRLKKRTDASARFEKSLDPQLTERALERFVALLHEGHIRYSGASAIATVGISEQKSMTLEVSHAFIESRLGAALSSKQVLALLQSLQFEVRDAHGVYHITIPSFRATKDIALPEDIVEEVGRIYGYEAIPEQLPSRQMKFFDIAPAMRVRAIKDLCAYGWNMQEVYTYAFFDELFLHQLGWQPSTTFQVQEAVSSNWQRLVTSLMPNLLKVVSTHAKEYNTLSFFEWARIWPHQKEESSLAGIWFESAKSVDFYEYKSHFNALEALLGMRLEWHKVESAAVAPWYLSNQTATLWHNKTYMGTAGILNPSFAAPVLDGNAFIFELNADFLMHHRAPIKRYVPSSRFPFVVRDISLLMPLAARVSQLQEAIQSLDSLIADVQLVDFYQKPEWHDKKSLTFRIVMVDKNATMTSEQAEAIMKKVSSLLVQEGATIR